MSFLAPAAFALAALIPIIIAMYLLKLRRTEQPVSSIYLWRKMVRDVEANAPWQRLRRNLLLLLQLLFVAALVLALARPAVRTQGISGQAAILILDTSASMAATDVQPTRLGAAQAQARQMVDDLPETARVTVIAAGDGARVVVAASQDRREVHLAIDGLQPGAGGSDLTAALELASAIAARQPDTEIAVFSDGRVTLPARLAIQGRVRFVPVGQSGENQAIAALSLQSGPGGRPIGFAQVANYGSQAVQRRLGMYAGGGLVNAHDLDIPAGETRAVVADDLPAGIDVLEARLEGTDALPLDDRAWAVSQPTEPAGVLLVTNGNLFLETALSLLPNIELTIVRPDDWEIGSVEGWETIEPTATLPISPSSNLPSFQSPNLTIFDTYSPITAPLPTGNLLFLGPPRSTDYFSVTGSVEQPVPRAVPPAGSDGDGTDPLLTNVSLAGVSVLDSVRLPLPEWARQVVAGDTISGSVPLLFAGQPDGRRVAVLAFDVRRSDLPLQVAFPLLLANLTGWLAPATGGDVPAQVAPGQAVSVALPPDVESAVFTRPDGSTVRAGSEAGQAVFAETAGLGVYQAAWGEDRQALFAVNLFAPQESDVRPADSLPLSGSGEGAAAGTQQARREWWRPLAIIALVLLMAEWLVYRRATIRRIWDLGFGTWAGRRPSSIQKPKSPRDAEAPGARREI